MSVDARTAFDEADAWLLSLIRKDGGRFSVRGQPWEERVRRHRGRQAETLEFLEFIGSPHERIRSVVVVGTSGKGTVTAMIAALLQSAGFNVADHTSPYLQLPTEKMRRNGQPIGPAEFAAVASDLQGFGERWCAAGHELRYGQASAALVMLWMARSGCDYCVYEASVGGRFSSAALLLPQVAVITNVGLDHVETLGPGLAEIAWHKAGIAQYAKYVVTSETDRQVLSILCEEASQFGVTVEEVTSASSGPAVSAEPEFQLRNAAAALAVVRRLGAVDSFDLPTGAVRDALCSSALPGRFEVIATLPRVLLDGAHNPDKVAALVARFRAEFRGERATVLFGALGSKSPAPMLAELAPIAREFLVTSPTVFGKDSTPAEDVRRLIEAGGWGPATVWERPLEAVERWLRNADPSETLLVTGSFYLVGEVRERWCSRNVLLSDDVSKQSCHNS